MVSAKLLSLTATIVGIRQLDYGLSRAGVQCSRIPLADDGTTDATDINPDWVARWAKSNGFELLDDVGQFHRPPPPEKPV
jgi:hypothetical protein